MKVIALLVIVASGLVFGLYRSGEHVACRDLDYDYSVHSVSELGLIAASCQQKELAALYYNRAYFADLFEARESQTFDPKLSYLSNSHRLYMGMLEAFAPQWYPDEKERVAFLNEQYQQASNVAELKLRSYDQFANVRRLILE